MADSGPGSTHIVQGGITTHGFWHVSSLGAVWSSVSRAEMKVRAFAAGPATPRFPNDFSLNYLPVATDKVSQMSVNGTEAVSVINFYIVAIVAIPMLTRITPLNSSHVQVWRKTKVNRVVIFVQRAVVIKVISLSVAKAVTENYVRRTGRPWQSKMGVECLDCSSRRGTQACQLNACTNKAKTNGNPSPLATTSFRVA